MSGLSPAASQLGTVIAETLAITVPNFSAEEFAAALTRYQDVLARLDEIDVSTLDLDDQVDLDLLDAHVRTRIFEIDDIALHRVDPTSYLALRQTSDLFVRPGAASDAVVREACAEMQRLPTVLANAQHNLGEPARVWTQNARSTVPYARMLLTESVPTILTDDPDLSVEVREAAVAALAALEQYDTWLERELLPRSIRSPAWTPAEIDMYQMVHEQLDGFDSEQMLQIAEREAVELTEQMTELAPLIHPSGDLRTVWEVMKDEAPPWDGVIPMAQRYVDMASAWLRDGGSHIVTIPDYLDYGAVLAPPMVRRILSFGGASAGPTVAGRQSGYYVLTPLEPWLTEPERASRIKSYNPYWTHVISYHEWLGHTVQIAARNAHVHRPMRLGFHSIYLSQAWSFYLEKLFEDEGYYDTLPCMEALKTRMARRQMRMWRVQRIITKIRMAKGEMTFDEAVEQYTKTIGMEPGNSFIEVQRDSQSPSPPGREIIGEIAILRLREEYARRMGPHYSLRQFHDTLLTYGDLPFAQIRRLMFRS